MKYTPVLKWKAGEQWALKNLPNSTKDQVLPVFEFVQKHEVSKTAKKLGCTTPEEELVKMKSSQIPQEILTSWGDGRKFFADFTLLYPYRVRLDFAEQFMKNAHKLHLHPIPVINAIDGPQYKNSLCQLAQNYANSKICVRFTLQELKKVQTVNTLLRTYEASGIHSAEISIIIDLKEDTTKSSFVDAVQLIQQIENLNLFDNVILGSGAFPKDMSQFKKDETNIIQRTDWNNWKALSSEALSRVPSFADYTIRHPVYDPASEVHSATATLKYTCENTWEIYKGRLVKYVDCMANAAVLITLSSFYGATFSAGDTYIHHQGQYFPSYMSQINSGQKTQGTGNAQNWIQASINHHIAVVVDQLAKHHDGITNL